LPVANSLAPAGRWLIHSGIQEPSGGFARYFNAETRKNRAISTEITGYALSALVYLFKTTHDEIYLDRARKTAAFLVAAWNERLQTFPFEHPSPSPESEHLAYFFDCGIIVRGLLSLWRETRDERLLEIAIAASHGMLADFRAAGEYHPILALPGKHPLPRTDQWSRAPGCYQLKSAMAWWDVAAITGDLGLRDAYTEALNAALSTRASFLSGDSCPHRIMDRLHPYCYFLEGLLPVLCQAGHIKVYSDVIHSIALCLNQISNAFCRSDVYAQLLRARLSAAHVIPVDCAAASAEAKALAGFQAISDDPRIDGGFFFGRRAGNMSPHVNPVSTTFALQALQMWQQFQADSPAEYKPPCHQMLI
jgi:hypothetical protein